MHAEHLGNGFALRVRLVSPSRESMVRNVTKEESASAPRHPIPRLAGGGTTKPTEPQPPAGAVAIASRERRRLPAQPPPALCFPDTWLWPVVGQPRDGGGEKTAVSRARPRSRHVHRDRRRESPRCPSRAMPFELRPAAGMEKREVYLICTLRICRGAML